MFLQQKKKLQADMILNNAVPRLGADLSRDLGSARCVFMCYLEHLILHIYTYWKKIFNLIWCCRNAYKQQDPNASRIAHTIHSNCICVDKKKIGNEAINEPGHAVNAMKHSFIKVFADAGIPALGMNVILFSALTGYQYAEGFSYFQFASTINRIVNYRFSLIHISCLFNANIVVTSKQILSVNTSYAIFTSMTAFRRVEESNFEYDRERRREMW